MKCPECSSTVTIEIGPERPLSMSLVDAVIAADEDERIDLSRSCWNCGWHETRSIRVDEIETVTGDEQVAKRASLINEITNEAKAIDHITILEEALAEVRRQRRLDPDGSSTSDTTPTEDPRS